MQKKTAIEIEKGMQADMLQLGMVLYSLFTGDKDPKLIGPLPDWVDSDLRVLFESLNKEPS